MTFSGRIRLYLAAIAVFPPLVILGVTFLYARNVETTMHQQNAAEAVARGRLSFSTISRQAAVGVERLAASPDIRQVINQLRAGRPTTLADAQERFGLDFAEIVSSADTVLATAGRPGLVGERLDRVLARPGDSLKASLTLEYDASGQHFALSCKEKLPKEYWLYAGQYIDSLVHGPLSRIVGTPVVIRWPMGNNASPYAAMQVGQLYQTGDSLKAVIYSSPDNKAFIVASFPGRAPSPLTRSLFLVTLLVTLISVGAAIGLGVLFTARTKREIDNLVTASQRVAAGDFETPVMAYEPGEFAYLADSFSDMIQRLRALQKKLATSEKIAAWQTVGRKIAHEIKNPLTPIGIAADDLRRSYHENLPGFDKILDEQTATIRTEVSRLLGILQEFIDFARMKAPQTTDVDIETFLRSLSPLYSDEVKDGRLLIENEMARRIVRFDPELMRQLLINLIKNGFESKPKAHVEVRAKEDGNTLVLTVEDNGSGFSADRLANAFEPFSTTKPDGTGLGLVISHRIVYDHGGTLELYNVEGGGAGVRIVLPQE